jgi:hypothetical protein
LGCLCCPGRAGGEEARASHLLAAGTPGKAPAHTVAGLSTRVQAFVNCMQGAPPPRSRSHAAVPPRACSTIRDLNRHWACSFGSPARAVSPSGEASLICSPIASAGCGSTSAVGAIQTILPAASIWRRSSSSLSSETTSTMALRVCCGNGMLCCCGNDAENDGVQQRRCCYEAPALAPAAGRLASLSLASSSPHPPPRASCKHAGERAGGARAGRLEDGRAACGAARVGHTQRPAEQPPTARRCGNAPPPPFTHTHTHTHMRARSLKVSLERRLDLAGVFPVAEGEREGPVGRKHCCCFAWAQRLAPPRQPSFPGAGPCQPSFPGAGKGGEGCMSCVAGRAKRPLLLGTPMSIVPKSTLTLSAGDGPRFRSWPNGPEAACRAPPAKPCRRRRAV